MRIREVVADVKSAKDMINEAARFGNKEKMEVIKKSNDFRIGIEYEFEVYESYLGSGYNESDVEPTDDEIEREVDEILSHPSFKKLINDMASLIVGVVDYMPMETLLNARDENPNQPVESDFYQNLFATIEELQVDDVFEYAIDIINFERDNRMVSFFELFSEAIEEYYGTGFASFKYPQGTREAAMYLKKLNEITEENKLQVLAAVKTFSDGFYDVFVDLEDHFMRKTWADVVRILSRDIASTSQLQDIATINAREILAGVSDDYSSDLNELAVSYVENEIPSHMSRYIEKVEEDSSLQHGAEVVTDPLTLADTFDFMEDMFAFIQNHGYTDDGCGMHVNISHRLMGKEVRLNPLRILTLLDPDFLQNRTVNRKLDKYEERSRYAQSFGSILARDDILGALVESYATKGFDALESDLSFYLVRSEKYRAINFTALFNVEQPDRRRIEVRLFGGKDYEKRFAEIQHDIYNLCYTIQAMVDPDFKKREHLEGIMRLLNRASARFDMNSTTTFMDLVARYRKTGSISA